MTPTRKRRLIMIGAILIAAAAATTLIVLALQQNMTYLFTPSEILAGKVPDGARFRIGGMVKQGSVERGQSLTVAFVVTDGDGDKASDSEVVDLGGNIPVIGATKSFSREMVYSLLSTWTKLAGKHAVKFGVDYRLARNSNVAPGGNATGPGWSFRMPSACFSKDALARP